MFQSSTKEKISDFLFLGEKLNLISFASIRTSFELPKTNLNSFYCSHLEDVLIENLYQERW